MTFKEYLISLVNKENTNTYCKGSFREEPFLISEEMLFSDINNEHNINEDTCVNIVWNSIFYSGMIKSGTCGNIEDANELLNTVVTVFTPNAFEPDTSFKNRIYNYLKKAKEVIILEEGSVIRTFKESAISGTKMSKTTNILVFTLGLEETYSIDMNKVISVYLRNSSNGYTLYISLKGKKYEERNI